MPRPTKKLGEVCQIQKGKKPHLYQESDPGCLPYLTAEVLRNGIAKQFASISDRNSVRVSEKEIIIICDGSNSGDVFFGYDGILASTMGKLVHSQEIYTKYLYLFLKQNFEYINTDKVGAATPHLNQEKFKNLEIPLPPFSEQKRIVEKIEKLFAKIDEAERLRAESLAASAALLPSALHQVFSRAKKENWPTKKLGDLLDYEQPTKYIVRSTNYKKFGSIPVLTAGKSFILGYTDEKDGIFPKDKLPVIIFDDFTTASKFVDFPFKVKSSAMKILHPKRDLVDAKYVFYKMQTIGFPVAQHKRYWISKYSQIKISLPPLPEQKKIVAYLDALSQKSQELQKLQQQTAADFSALRQSVLAQAFNQALRGVATTPTRLTEN
jgi:type I restriction enzyme S subunit